MALYEAADFTSTFYGNVKRSTAGAITAFDGAGAAKRDLGIVKEEIDIKNFNDAVADPATYLAARLAALKRLNVEVLEFYKREYVKLYEDVSYSDVEARNVALEHTRERKKQLLIVFNQQWPLKIKDAAIESGMKKNTTLL